MQYIFFLLFSIVGSLLVLCFFYKKKLWDLVERKKWWIFLGLLGTGLLFIAQAVVYPNTTIMNTIKLCILFVILFVAAIVDLKKKIIPNALILLGLGCRVFIYILEIFFTENLKQILWNDLIGFLIGFGVLAIISVVTKQALGFGDVKLFAVIGIMSGAYATYSVLFVSVFISALVSIALLVSRKKGRKDSIPFGPCIFIGYFLVLLIGSY